MLIFSFSAEEERERLAKMYNDVLDLVPAFREQMINFETDPEALDNIINVVRDIIVSGAKKAHRFTR